MAKSSAPAAQSPIKDSSDLNYGSRLTLREDGSVTVLVRGRGIAAKTVTMFPAQWRNLFSISDGVESYFESNSL